VLAAVEVEHLCFRLARDGGSCGDLPWPLASITLPSIRPAAVRARSMAAEPTMRILRSPGDWHLRAELTGGYPAGGPPCRPTPHLGRLDLTVLYVLRYVGIHVNVSGISTRHDRAHYIQEPEAETQPDPLRLA
jgi:hypothetical protein